MENLRSKDEYLEMFKSITEDYGHILKGYDIIIESTDELEEPTLGKCINKSNRNTFIIKVRHKMIIDGKHADGKNGPLDYFKSLNIQEDQYNDAFNVSTFLHELGHAIRYILILDKFNTNVKTIKSIENIRKDIVSTCYGENFKLNPYRAFYDTSELHSNVFKYYQFPIVWNRLKDRGFIK